MKTGKIVLWSVVVLIGLGILSFVFGVFGEAADVAQEEFGPRAALEKYEWFIDASEQLDKKLNDITVYEANVNQMKEDYSNIPRNEWDRVDKQQYNQWNMEVAGIKASYNTLAAEYNAQSQKFNWKTFKAENPKYEGVPEIYLEK